MNQSVKFKCLSDRILVEQMQVAQPVSSLIYIPDSAQQKPQQGIVVNVGPGKRDAAGDLVPMLVQPGDQVLFGSKAGTEITVNSQTYLVMHQEEVLAVLKS